MLIAEIHDLARKDMSEIRTLVAPSGVCAHIWGLEPDQENWGADKLSMDPREATGGYRFRFCPMCGVGLPLGSNSMTETLYQDPTCGCLFRRPSRQLKWQHPSCGRVHLLGPDPELQKLKQHIEQRRAEQAARLENQSVSGDESLAESTGGG